MKKVLFNFKRISQFGYKDTLDVIKHSIENEMEEIVQLIEKNQEDSMLIEHLKRYFIIRALTIIESTFRDLSIRLVDYYGFDISNLFDTNSIEIPFRAFDEIKSNRITKGRIVATNFNFQDISDINKVFSKLLDFDFKETVKSIPINEKYYGNPFVNWDKFWNLLRHRHQLVHEFSTKTDYTIEEIKQISIAVDLFLYYSTVSVFVYVYYQKPDLLKEDLPTIYDFVQELMKPSKEN